MQKLVIIAILFLAAVLRINQLASLPALNADEAAIGYNAYSLLRTGKDEHGNPWPVHFQSFNDYKPGLFFYIVLPFVKFLGLNELAVRLPGALFGIATVLPVWLLVRQLFPGKKWLAELAALFLAISPWHIHFSRGGWEVNAATFFITLGVVGFVQAIKDPRWWYLSTFGFVAALYTYHAARIVVPLLLLGLVLLNKPIRLIKIRRVLAAGFLGILLLVPLVLDLAGPAGVSRVAGVGLFADTGPFWRINQQRGEHIDFTGPLAVVLHNKAVNYSLAFFENYVEHFWGEFLFLSGDEIQRNKVPETGQVYLFDLLFLTAGFFAIARRSAGWSPVLLWLLVAPTAAALTFQSPHALRAQNMVIPLVIISAFGAHALFGLIASSVHLNKLRVTCYVLLVAFVVWNFARYLHQYYNHMVKTYDFSSQYGLKELVTYVAENQHKHARVVVTDRYDQPYIFFLFYSAYPPEKFQKEHVLTERDEFGFSTIREFGKYRFAELGLWEKTRQEHPGALIAGSADEIPEGANIVKTIYFPSGRVAFKIVAN